MRHLIKHSGKCFNGGPVFCDQLLFGNGGGVIINDFVFGGFGIFQNNAQYFAYNIELVYKINKNIGISAYYESGGGGKNIISAPVLNAGVFYTL